MPKLSVEAGVAMGWSKWVDASVSLERFGPSAPGPEVYEQLGFTADNGRGRRGVVTLPLCPGRSSTTRLHRWSFRWFSFGRLILARASRSRLPREAIRDA